MINCIQFSSVQSLSLVRLCDPMNHSTPGLPVHHQLLEFTRLTSIESVIPSSHLILCHPLLLLPPIPPSIRVFSNELTLHVVEFQLEHHSFQRMIQYLLYNIVGIVLSILQTSFHLVLIIFLQNSYYLHLQKTTLAFLFLAFLITVT